MLVYLDLMHAAPFVQVAYLYPKVLQAFQSFGDVVASSRFHWLITLLVMFM